MKSHAREIAKDSRSELSKQVDFLETCKNDFFIEEHVDL